MMENSKIIDVDDNETTKHDNKTKDVERRQSADIWKHFDRGTEKGTAVCKICKSVLKSAGGCTSGLITHAKTKHEIQVLKRKICTAESSATKRRITQFFHQTKKDKDSLEVVLSRMIALDGLTFRVFTTSLDLRRALQSDGYNIPKSPNTIRKIVMEFAEKVREQQKNEIVQLLEKGDRFSITHDEWSSIKRHRYLNIVLHHDKDRIWNLGLIRVKGTMTAETIVQKIDERLMTFELSVDRHVICQMTDGCKTMQKVGKISTCDQQLCYAHGIQLGVLDVLYQKMKPKTANENDGDDSGNNECCDDEDDKQESISDDDNEDDIGDDDLFSFAENWDEVNGTFVLDKEKGEKRELTENLKGAVDMVRQIVKSFKNSPVKNDVLQSYVTDEFKKENQLKLDCKTRWNSLFDMCDTFCVLQKPIKKALLDVGDGLNIDDEELSIVTEIVDALKPLKAAVEALCRRDANLLTADAILSFAMNQLQQQNTSLSNALFDALEKRILERRTHLSGVLKYLHTGSFSNLNDSDEVDGNLSSNVLEIFDIPSKKVVESVIIRLLTRLDSEQQQRDEEAGAHEKPPLETSDSDLRKHTKNYKRSRSELHQNLDKAISKAMSSKVDSDKIQSESDLLKLVRKEMSLLEGGGGRGPSPLTLGSSIPIAAAIQECVSARFKGSNENKCISAIYGVLKIAFPTGILQILMNQPLVNALTFKLVNTSKISKINCNKEVILSYKRNTSNNEINFEMKMDGLIQNLKQSFEKSPAARYFNVEILRYQLECATGVRSCPLQVVTHWKCESQTTCLKIDYKYNPYALSSLEPLRNVAFSVKVDNVIDLQSKPQADWNSSTKQICWKIEQISRLSEGYGIGSLRAKLTVDRGPTSPSPVFIQLHCANSTFSGIHFELMTSAYRVSVAKKQCSSGQYISEADSSISYVSV